MYVGIDRGSSQMAVAVVRADGTVLRHVLTRTPLTPDDEVGGDLARLASLLPRIADHRGRPVTLAGHCYESSGVRELFRDARWTVRRVFAFNDAVNHYGLGSMPGNVVLAACGTWPQVVYIDAANNVRWPGDDVALPAWTLSGRAYAEFLVSRRPHLVSVLSSPRRWIGLGRLLGPALTAPDVPAFVEAGADAAVRAHRVLWEASGVPDIPRMVFGGGAVRDDRIWSIVRARFERAGVPATRVRGRPAVGAVRYARANPDADVWGYVGDRRPSWLE